MIATARRAVATLVPAALAAGLFVAGPAIATPDNAPQASASYEDVRNSKNSTRNLSVRIQQRNGVVVDRIVSPGTAVNAGRDRISSYYIHNGTCASIYRGGVHAGFKVGPDRVGLAQGERIEASVKAC